MSKQLPQIKYLIAIASGKGGVGKSTTAVNLALALKANGAEVGLLDADLYGPSHALMLGATDRPESLNGQALKPLICHGIESMSIAYLLDHNDTPVIWRGPIATNTVQQLLFGTQWGHLDYLIIDLPPGTGDIHITLVQKISLSAAIIITTPQDLALLDARKALQMFTKVKVPILGIIENMSTHICTQCGHEEHLFGTAGGTRIAEQYDVPLLGKLPLEKTIREDSDNGTPTVVAAPESQTTARYLEIASQVSARLAEYKQDFTSKFPNIVVEHT